MSVGAAPSNQPIRDPDVRRSGILPVAMLLALAGGCLDAFLYLDHGGVFAGAMTGNAVLAGIALLSHDRQDAAWHLFSIGTFLIGVLLAKLLDSFLGRRAVRVGLLGEMAGLILASAMPRGFPDLVFVPWITLLAAYQITTFRKVGEFTYNSTFITSNLRTIVDGLYEAMYPPRRREGLRKARDLAAIVASFVTGAVLGALLAPRAFNRTLWVPAGALLVALIVVEWRSPAPGGASRG